jgi:hypothetical protein
VLVSLAILGVAITAFVVQRLLVASAPSSSSAEVGQSTSRQTALYEADGVIPDGVAVSVFDEQIPAVGNLEPDLLDALQRTATDAASPISGTAARKSASPATANSRRARDSKARRWWWRKISEAA